jgi:hypothetical protein
MYSKKKYIYIYMENTKPLLGEKNSRRLVTLKKEPSLTDDKLVSVFGQQSRSRFFYYTPTSPFTMTSVSVKIVKIYVRTGTATLNNQKWKKI